MLGRPARPITYRLAGDCWLCTSHSQVRGIPQLVRQVDGRAVHFSLLRLVFAQAHGPIPAGLVVKPTCGNRACLNPAHLQTVPHAANGGGRPRGRAWTTWERIARLEAAVGRLELKLMELEADGC